MLNEKIMLDPDITAESTLMVIEQEKASIEQVGRIEFEGLAKLKSSVIGGYNKESVLDIVDKIVEQSEMQLRSIKRYAQAQDERNAALTQHNTELRSEIYRLMCQIKEDQDDFVARNKLKDEQIDLLQRENQQLREKIGRDKKTLIERTERHIGTLKAPVKLREISPDMVPVVPKKKGNVGSETRRLLDQVTEFLNSDASMRRCVEEFEVVDPKRAVPESGNVKKGVHQDRKEVSNLTSGGDMNWDLDSILKEYGE